MEALSRLSYERANPKWGSAMYKGPLKPLPETLETLLVSRIFPSIEVIDLTDLTD